MLRLKNNNDEVMHTFVFKNISEIEQESKGTYNILSEKRRLTDRFSESSDIPLLKHKIIVKN